VNQSALTSTGKAFQSYDPATEKVSSETRSRKVKKQIIINRWI